MNGIEWIKASSKKLPSSKSNKDSTNVSVESNILVDIDDKLFMCETMNHLCPEFEYLNYIPEERYFVCDFCIIFLWIGGVHVPHRYEYNLSNTVVYVNHNIMSREFKNIKTHLKRHLENVYHLKNIKEWKREVIANLKSKIPDFSIGMRIARISYSMYKAGYLKQSSKMKS